MICRLLSVITWTITLFVIVLVHPTNVSNCEYDSNDSNDSNIIHTKIIDLVEINHKYNKQGGISFDQIIFWKFYRNNNTGHTQLFVIDWRPLKNCREILTDEEHGKKKREFQRKWSNKHPGYIVPPYVLKWTGCKFAPRYDVKSRLYVMIWYDKQTQCMIKVISTMYIETWTQDDPEMEDRKILPQDEREKLVSKFEKLDLTPPRVVL